MKWIRCTEPRWAEWYDQRCEVVDAHGDYGKLLVRHPTNGSIGTLFEKEYVVVDTICGNCERIHPDEGDYLCPECRLELPS
jgi:hypothetical protein